MSKIPKRKEIRLWSTLSMNSIRGRNQIFGYITLYKSKKQAHKAATQLNLQVAPYSLSYELTPTK